MSWNVKTLFMKETEEKPKDVASAQILAKETATGQPKVTSFGNFGSTTYTPSGNTVPTYTGQGTLPINSKYDEHFEKVMKEANLPGPDYREFSQALKKMDGKAFTDQQKFEAIFMGFEVQGLTPDTLVETAGKYIVVLQGEEKDFSNEISLAQTEQVTNKQDEIAILQKKNEELTKQMQENQQKVEQLNNEVICANQKLEQEKSSFLSSLNTKISVINDHIAKIKLYLKPQ